MDQFSPICILLTVLCAAFHQVNGLRCYACKHVERRGCPGLYNVAEIDCDPAQDVCFEFEGDVVVGDSLPLTNLTTKSCVEYAIMQQYSGAYNFQQNGCVMVNHSKDPFQNQFFTGRFCLCNDKDFCNTGSFNSKVP